MEQLVDTKNKQAEIMKRNMKEYEALQNKQEKFLKRKKKFEDFVYFMNNIDVDKQEFSNLDIEITTKSTEIDYGCNYDTYWGLTLYSKGHGDWKSNDIKNDKDRRDIIYAMINAGLEVIDKQIEEINQQILDFNFLKGVNKDGK